MGEQRESTGRINPARFAGSESPDSSNAGNDGMAVSSSASSFIADMEHGGASGVAVHGGGLAAHIPALAEEHVQGDVASSISSHQVENRMDGDELATNDSETMGSDFQVEQTASDGDDVEGLDSSSSWGDYPIDDMFMRHEVRTVYDILRRIGEGRYIMNPDFQRGFVWSKKRQSKLIESAIMRIPLPVVYLAENDDGKMVVVDGLQRLTTFQNFIRGGLKLGLPDREELNGKAFSELEPRFKNRIEDCNLHVYIIDSNVPESARLDIFERVNGGVALTRQQMRNCLFMGQATKFLRDESETEEFLKATGGSLDPKKMRDREFINRFCAFSVVGLDEYRGDMDRYLADCLRTMNKMERETGLVQLSNELRRGLKNNFLLFGEHSFRKRDPNQERRSVINAALWDVMSTEFSLIDENTVIQRQNDMRSAIQKLIANEKFLDAITRNTGDTKQVRKRFELARTALSGVKHD